MTRFDDQVLRRFLAAAAVAFALVGEPPPSMAASAEVKAPVGERSDAAGTAADPADPGVGEGRIGDSAAR